MVFSTPLESSSWHKQDRRQRREIATPVQAARRRESRYTAISNQAPEVKHTSMGNHEQPPNDPTGASRPADERAPALPEGEHFLQRLTETAPSVIYVYDLAANRNIYANRRLAEMLGYTVDEIQAMGERFLPGVIHPDDWATTPAHIVRLLALADHEVLEREYRLRHKDGGWRWVFGREMVFARGADGRPTQVLGSVIDVTERRRAEEALRESEARLSALLEQLPLGVGMVDREGRWTLRNPSLARFVGDRLPSLDVAAMHRWRSWAPDGQPLDPSRWPGARALRGEIVSPGVEFLHTLPDGREIWTRVSAAPFRREDGAIAGAICVIQDIDKRKRGEEALRRQSELTETILENGTVGMFMMDSKGYCTYMNRAGESMFGWTFEEIRQRPLHDVIHHHHPDGRPYPLAECPIDRALPENFGMREHEDNFIRRDGSFIPVLVAASPIFDATGRPVATVLEVRDVSERRQAEAATLRRSEQLRRLAAAASQLHAARDGASILRLLTEEARALIGARRAETLTVAPLSEHAGDAPPDESDCLSVPLVGLDGHKLGLVRLSHKDEGQFTADDEAMLIQLAQLAAIALENQALYTQERAARKEAEEANRLKDEFLATISHELRTPLTAFLGYAQMLQRRPRDEAYVSRTVDKMVRSALAQAQLIEDLLDVSRIVSGRLRLELRPLDLAPVVQAALDTIRPTADAKRLRLAVVIEPGVAPVIGDASRLQQVIWNLLSNAAKFTPAGGTITVRLEADGSNVCLTVSDTGQGISPAFLPFVFDRFRQSDSSSHRAHSGLGLGLAIVRHLVELHGGTVEARSEGADCGAAFAVRLPAATGALAPASPDAPAALAPADEGLPELDGLRVLLVDDQPEILELVADTLGGYGALVRSALNAREALALLRSWRPDVLVSDIAMPGEDGYWLIRQVRALPPEEGGLTPAAALTAYVRIEERLKVLAAGFQQYVPKPVEPGELREIIAGLAAGAAGE
jgi:PAS domain S-box-containing protein